MLALLYRIRYAGARQNRAIDKNDGADERTAASSDHFRYGSNVGGNRSHILN